ncbi:unnamed protein product [Larinioides sclopetarius]|uniref:Uncharacterized protein n=1 Tax=Larinioides sclopetarius TaxID=280406 RepID=A0AAV2A195_9ARAC
MSFQWVNFSLQYLQYLLFANCGCYLSCKICLFLCKDINFLKTIRQYVVFHPIDWSFFYKFDFLLTSLDWMHSYNFSSSRFLHIFIICNGELLFKLIIFNYLV